MRAQFTPNDIERFWSKVDRSGGPEACWPWLGRCAPFGYGLFDYAGGKKNTGAHRVVWVIVNGEVPDGMEICHDCDNPPCVNPAHLFIGTQLDNMRDKESKGRGYHGTAWHPVGTRNPKAKLTDAQIIEVRTRYGRGGVSKSALAREYGVSSTLMSWVMLQRVWRHLPSVEELQIKSHH